MSEFYNTFAALVAHLQDTLPAEPNTVQETLLSTAVFKLNILNRCMTSAQRNQPLIDDLQALFETPATLTDMLSNQAPGGALVLRGIDEAVEFAAEMSCLLLATALPRKQ